MGGTTEMFVVGQNAITMQQAIEDMKGEHVSAFDQCNVVLRGGELRHADERFIGDLKVALSVHRGSPWPGL